mmetsp:Transcript_20282/g.41785  ORF Transcript_20282/g.41785 Transcript_20282/m.41785 type:complete len:80 (-) Transcript_20282:396-635(-)
MELGETIDRLTHEIVQSSIHIFLHFLDSLLLVDQRLRKECAPEYTSEWVSMIDSQESSRFGYPPPMQITNGTPRSDANS